MAGLTVITSIYTTFPVLQFVQYYCCVGSIISSQIFPVHILVSSLSGMIWTAQKLAATIQTYDGVVTSACSIIPGSSKNHCTSHKMTPSCENKNTSFLPLVQLQIVRTQFDQ